LLGSSSGRLLIGLSVSVSAKQCQPISREEIRERGIQGAVPLSLCHSGGSGGLLNARPVTRLQVLVRTIRCFLQLMSFNILRGHGPVNTSCSRWREGVTRELEGGVGQADRGGKGCGERPPLYAALCVQRAVISYTAQLKECAATPHLARQRDWCNLSQWAHQWEA